MLLQMRDATCITVSHTPIMTELTQKATMSLVTQNGIEIIRALLEDFIGKICRVVGLIEGIAQTAAGLLETTVL